MLLAQAAVFFASRRSRAQCQPPVRAAGSTQYPRLESQKTKLTACHTPCIKPLRSYHARYVSKKYFWSRLEKRSLIFMRGRLAYSPDTKNDQADNREPFREL